PHKEHRNQEECEIHIHKKGLKNLILEQTADSLSSSFIKFGTGVGAIWFFNTNKVVIGIVTQLAVGMNVFIYALLIVAVKSDLDLVDDRLCAKIFFFTLSNTIIIKKNSNHVIMTYTLGMYGLKMTRNFARGELNCYYTVAVNVTCDDRASDLMGLNVSRVWRLAKTIERISLKNSYILSRIKDMFLFVSELGRNHLICEIIYKVHSDMNDILARLTLMHNVIVQERNR
ncbi:hypothetical protein ACJX0J_025350, partial [Zea mays]